MNATASSAALPAEQEISDHLAQLDRQIDALSSDVAHERSKLSGLARGVQSIPALSSLHDDGSDEQRRRVSELSGRVDGLNAKRLRLTTVMDRIAAQKKTVAEAAELRPGLVKAAVEFSKALALATAAFQKLQPLSERARELSDAHAYNDMVIGTTASLVELPAIAGFGGMVGPLKEMFKDEHGWPSRASRYQTELEVLLQAQK